MKKRVGIKKKSRFRDIKDIKKNSPLKITLALTIVSSVIVVIILIYMQLFTQSKITQSCSYYDPIAIDILAFIASLFFAGEGFLRIIENPNAPVKRQLSRVFRIVAGLSIFSLHVIQFIHK